MADLQELLDDTARDAGVPGAAVGIFHDGAEILLGTGVSSVDAPVPVDADTLFLIGSTTKTFTATLLVALAEDGLLDLDKPVAGYLPKLRLADPDAQAVITARHLLTHTAGLLGDVDLDTGWGDDALASAIATFGELPQIFAPGTVFSYSNSGFLLAGYLAEVVGGAPYEDLVRTRILEPLGLRDSVFQPWEAMLRKHSVGHDGDGVASTLGLSRATAAAGGLWSTARDQLRWAKFFLTGETEGHAPISAAGRAAMWVPQRTAALPMEEVGLSWLRTRHGDAGIVRHGGNVSNLQVSEFWTLPSANLAVTVLTNSAGGAVLGPAIVDWCAENLAGLPRLGELPVVEPADSLSAYVGRFRTGDLAFDITLDGGTLSARMVFPDNPELPQPPSAGIAFVGDDVFTRADDPRRRLGRFVRDGDGRVAMLEYGGRTALRA